MQPASRSLSPSVHPSSPPVRSGPPSQPSIARGRRVHAKQDLIKVAVGALGVVYGDIGTSPLYALRECFTGKHRVEPTPENVLGILSLVFWSLLLVVVFKYLTFIMRADNHGEGGILSLLALIAPRGSVTKKRTPRSLLIMLGLFGASLLYGDGIITPAISVLSAMEGLQIANRAFQPVVVPGTIAILVSLFLLQKRGTDGIRALFGPVMLLWFVSIAAWGVPWIVRNPHILAAVSPHHAALFFVHHKLHAFLALGAVVLCVTGSEALYTDMGHFGVRSIRLAWYCVVWPALLISYFAQGSLMLERGASVANPFYELLPRWGVYPMVVLAAAATVVASQALISGAFSLTRQAVQLGLWPRVTIKHTSEEAEGQIYVPEINSILMLGCVWLVFAFRHEGSSGLAAAYGIAVTGTMVITSLLFAVVAHEQWDWSERKLGLIVGTFLIVDLSFFSANLVKVTAGGWIPLAIATAVYIFMSTWKAGRTTLEDFVRSASLPLELFMCDLESQKPRRVRGTAVFMTSNVEGTPVVLLHHFKHNKCLHEQIVLLSVVTDRIPEVDKKSRVSVKEMGQGFFVVVAHYGFMQTPNVPDILRACQDAGLIAPQNDTSYFLGRETLLTTGKTGLWKWRKILFAFLARNAKSATSFFGLPPNRVVEMGAQIEL